MALPAPGRAAAIGGSRATGGGWWLTVDLSLNGHAPIYIADAKITSQLPPNRQAEASQRRRWLQGHLACVLMQGPRLLLGAIRQRRLDLLALLADLLVPPLSLLLVLWLPVFSAALIAGTYGRGWAPAGVLSALGGLLMAVALTGVLWQCGGPDEFGRWARARVHTFEVALLFFVHCRTQGTGCRTGRETLPKVMVACRGSLGEPDANAGFRDHRFGIG